MSAAEQPPRRLCLVGEGDFTLALSLATQLKHVAITATGFDTHADLIKKYRDAPATLRRLQAAGAIAKHGVDACALQGSYDEVHFGHPHLGVENAAAHHRLLAHYFHSAKQVAPVVRVTLASDDAGTYATPWYAFKWPTLTDPEGVERDYIKYPGTCVPHDVHGDTTPTSEVADMGWAKAAAITYHDDLAPVKIPVFYPASFCTPSTRRRRGRGAIAGQHARRVHGPRAGVARRRRLDPADAERRQP